MKITRKSKLIDVALCSFLACTFGSFVIGGCTSERAYVIEPGHNCRLAEDKEVMVWVKDKDGNTIKTKAKLNVGMYCINPPNPGPLPDDTKAGK